ncbi:uncharacterized protein BX664DRAFT_333604 [Halteromyces radiatus]|uniref:uncharacterized protein n=1 Tax=Halteromyces radiatus TaxID=101107 RepID=UPI002220C594|nr:uncharacterized protein BX664DRAFT_333604 [Halteromyces radiatus]KAI8089671.1 hypothetical protein BX664DRAFT_333604 [Halteromyces radiatus]
MSYLYIYLYCLDYPCLIGSSVPISRHIHDTSNIPFEEHNLDMPWLGMQLDYTYIEPILEILNSTEQPLLSRQEAHITVISPPEYRILSTSTNITIDELNHLAKSHKIQSSIFSVVCLGKVIQKENNFDHVVYQLIISSPSLIKLRESIFRLFYIRKGNPSLFDPHAFWPHITIGFTDHDLFVEQGIYKGLNACYRPITYLDSK